MAFGVAGRCEGAWALPQGRPRVVELLHAAVVLAALCVVERGGFAAGAGCGVDLDLPGGEIGLLEVGREPFGLLVNFRRLGVEAFLGLLECRARGALLLGGAGGLVAVEIVLERALGGARDFVGGDDLCAGELVVVFGEIGEEGFGGGVETGDELEELRVGRCELGADARELVVLGFELANARVAVGVGIEEERAGADLLGDGAEIVELAVQGVGGEGPSEGAGVEVGGHVPGLLVEMVGTQIVLAGLVMACDVGGGVTGLLREREAEDVGGACALCGLGGDVLEAAQDVRILRGVEHGLLVGAAVRSMRERALASVSYSRW